MKLSSIVLASLLTVPATLAASSGIAAAQPTATVAASLPAPIVETQLEKKNSINVSPLGLAFGNLYLTYEHLFERGHGLVIDVGGGSSDDSDVSESHGAVGVGYRWHWRGQQDSGFVGVMLHQSYGSGSATIDVGGDLMAVDMTTRSTQLTANVGKRWMLGDDFNVSLRFGLGWGHHVAEANVDGERAQKAEDAMNALLSVIPFGIDGELSVGYHF